MKQDKQLEQQIDALLQAMTLEEKVGQLNQSPLLEPVEKLEEGVRSGAIGSLVLAYTPFAGTEEQQDQIAQRQRLSDIAKNESRLGIPLLLGRDVIHGHRTVFPIPLAQAAAWSPELAEQAAAAAAAEAMEENVGWTFAPVADLARDPRWGRIVEGYGEDPLLSAAYVSHTVRGFQSSGVFSACIKHYIGYGATEGGRDYSGADVSPSVLYNCYLPPFKAAVDAGVDTVMVSFNDVNGIPATASKALVTDLLKKELGFEGFVVSDWDSIGQLVTQGVAADRREAARLAFEAGVDMDMCSGCYSEYLPELIREGVCSQERLDDAVRRILRVKFKRCGKNLTGAPSVRARTIARKFVEKSMVLLKNEKDLLPLKENEPVALIGSVAWQRRIHLGCWTLDGRGEETASIAEELEKRRSFYPVPEDDPEKAREAARKAEIAVVVLGENWELTGEGGGCALLQLPESQLELLEAVAAECDRVVAVVCGGRPLCLDRVAAWADSILYAWHSGSEAAAAIAAILCGETEPGGRLPVTLPRHVGQVPLYYNQRPAARAIDNYYGKEEIRAYRDFEAAPLYPFGWGMGYTQFQYGEITLRREETETGEVICLSCLIRNIGSRPGEEVCQCYIQGRGGVVRPLRELKGFCRTALEPGQSRQIEFRLRREDLAWRGPEGAVCTGRFTAWIGGNCLTQNSIDFELR